MRRSSAATAASSSASSGPPPGRRAERRRRTSSAFAAALCDLEADALLLGAGLLADPSLLERFWVEIHRQPYGIGRLRRPLTDYLAAEQGRGGIGSSVDIEAVTTLMFGASAMAALQIPRHRHADRDEVDRQLSAAVATIVSGIEP